MKAEELMIGNYVFFNNKISKVSFLREDGKIGVIFSNIYRENIYQIEPIPLTEEWLLKFGFENWGLGKLYSNEHEKYTRYVLHNIIDGTSNFEVHFVTSNYGGVEHTQFIISCDEDDRINFGIDIEYVNQLQNLYFALTGTELELNKES